MQYYRDALDRQRRLSRRMAVFGVLANATVLSWPFQAAHSTSPEGPSSFLTRVTAVPDGRLLRTEDGTEIVLPHILPPGPDRHAPMEDLGPKRRAAAALADLALGREVRVDLSIPGRDRHGRWRGQVTAEGIDLAAAMAQAGMVRVFPEPGADAAQIAPLLSSEAKARDGGVGFWETGYYAVHDALSYDAGSDRFEIVSGTVRRQSRVGERLHLEFGEDWRSDFTAGLSRRLVRASGVENLDGETLTLRGWVRMWNGPFMEIEEAVQIEGL